MKFQATKKQEELFNKVIQAMELAKKGGLFFYGKSGALVAYTKQVENYVDEHGFEELLRGRGNQIPYLTSEILSDSGADDYISYRTQEDEEKYS